jgi:alpha-L-rhamnosidase
LGFGAVPDSNRKAVFEQLVADLASKPDGPALTTGIYGTRKMLEQLTQRGRHDLALALADRKTFPSWGWMLENGATTLWETWKQSDNTFSHNHPMFGSISAWFFRHLGGIQITDDAVAADRIIIRPQTAGGMTWVKSSHRSIRGLIESNWRITDKGTEFDIVIPPDTSAVIQLPAGSIIKAEANGAAIQLPPENQTTAGSGRYNFLIAP